MRQVRADEFRAEQIVGVGAQSLTVGVVNGRFERAGRNVLCEPRHRFGQAGRAHDGLGGRTLGLGKLARDIQGVPNQSALRGRFDEAPPEGNHRVECLRA